MKIFIDSSVLIAACKSKSGGSARILMECRRKKIQGYVSRHVVVETKKAAEAKFDQTEKQRLNFFLLQSHLIFCEEPSLIEVNHCQEVLPEKDAPILAAAIKNKADFLITLDTGNFMKTTVKEIVKPVKIVTPKDFIKL